ncbi:MAG: branched-chain amino acid ABC transporter permease [Ruminococcaceae bacterium]|nr:branched-chain amino acid ABC transporter permease [Oscillospiraceae bacterium]
MKKFKNIPGQTISDFITYAIVVIAFLIIQPMKSAGLLSNSFSGLLIPICTYIVMAVSLNLTVGILGELSLGHAGFMSVGAFSGIIAVISLDGVVTSNILRLVIAMVIGGIMAGITGFLIGIPVLRLRGDYLAIVTLAFGEIIKNIINCLYIGIDESGLHFSMESAAALDMVNGKVIINGPIGAVGVPKISTFVVGFVLIMVTLIVVLNFKRSRTGRAVMALRDNRIAAESVGISVTKYKLIAFITSAVLAGMAGTLYAMNYTTLAAKKFDFNTSILVLVFVVLGGMGNIRGSIIATAILYLLPELILREFSDYRMLIYAIILIAVMLFTNSIKVKQFAEGVKSKLQSVFKREKNKNKGGATE